MNEGKKSIESVNTAVLGIVLMGVGIVFFLLNILDVDYGRFGWPFFIIIPGAVLFISALAVDESMGQALAITGGIIITAGTILFYQNLTNHWTSWAYAWALVAPGSIGLAQFIFGSLRKQTKMIKEGRQLLLIGLAIFFGGFVFFELIIGISGFSLGRYGWPLLLIALGVLLLARGLFTERRKQNQKEMRSEN